MKIDIEKFLKPNLNEARKRSKEQVSVLYFNMSEKMKSLGIGKTYSVQTYGCQGNEADSETLSGILEAMGYKKSLDKDVADIVLLNTCAIRENAEQKIWGIIGRLKKQKTINPNMILGICGCMPQEEKVFTTVTEKYPYVDLVFGTHNISKLPEFIESCLESRVRVLDVLSYEGNIVEHMPKTRESMKKAWVSIMYGCDEFCTYCIVPYTRGKERSRHHEDIIEEVKGLVEEGYIEVTLLGQNVNAYGKDFSNVDYTFGDLLRDLDKTGIKRIRFTTSHPRDLDDKTIFAMRDCKSVMPAIHLPVQSGSNEVLKRMNRKYTKEDYLLLIEKLKENIKGISITTDIIVGFPGETEEQFLDTIDLVEKVSYEGAYTFVYSPREGTPASKYEDNLTEDEKKERLYELNKHINDGYLKGNERFLGSVVHVLVDGYSKTGDNMLCGYTEHNKLVNFAGTKEMIGEIVDVKITSVKTWFLMGELA